MVVFEVNFPKLSYAYKFMILFCFVLYKREVLF